MNVNKNNRAGDSIMTSPESAQPVTQNTQHGPRNTQRGSWWWINLGKIDYDDAWKLQTAIVDARNNEILREDIILVLEHPAVFTLGRRGGAENLLVSESFLKQSGIAVTQVERGGNITYHGPGQLVVYPILDLEAARISVVDFVKALEEIMLQTVADLGINAERNALNHGIWVGNQKLGSIGIALRKGVSFHGLALNVNLDLTPFSWIQPCGLQGVQMTSVKQELARDVSISDVQALIRNKFQSIFGVALVNQNRSELMGSLTPGKS
jgi:lipoate-protein ligase B